MSESGRASWRKKKYDLGVLKDESEFFQIDESVKGIPGPEKVRIKAQKHMLNSTDIYLVSIDTVFISDFQKLNLCNKKLISILNRIQYNTVIVG